jgi:DNA-binding LytR/AlgR family response regulator
MIKNTESYKCIIIDDEPIAIRVIANYLKNIQQIESVGEFTNALEALKILHSQNVDLLFLDIQMPGINGLDFIKTLANPPKVIYTTAFRNYAADAFDVDAIDYLVKPIPFDRFVKAINRFIDKMQVVKSKGPDDEKDFLILRSDKKNHKIKVDEILYIESLDDYVRVHTRSNKLVCYTRLVKLEALLKSYSQLVRIHRSFIVNLNNISSFTHFNVEVSGNTIPIGRSYKDQVIKLCQNDL